MSLGTVPSEGELLEQVAHDYRQRGYDVVREPALGERPSFLGPLVPDLIAKKGAKTSSLKSSAPRFLDSLTACVHCLKYSESSLIGGFDWYTSGPKVNLRCSRCQR